MKIEKIEKENIIIFTPSELREKYKISLFFTSKKGGYSKGKYKSLNLGFHVEDDPENVTKNRNKVLNLFDCNKTNGIFSLNQIHSDKIFSVDNKFIKAHPELINGMPGYLTPDIFKISADGLITNISKFPLAVLGADCNLILMADVKNRVISAVHAGWKGVLKKIELNAITLFESKYGSDLNSIIVFIGPSIRKCCFKVKQETFNLFFKIYKNNLPVKKITDSFDGNDYYFIDLVEIIKNNLINAGIPEKNIFDSGLCTSCNEDNLFFSYRKEKKTGRQAGIIMLE